MAETDSRKDAGSSSAELAWLDGFPLNKEQAIDAMHKGYKVRHKYFTDEEWMCDKGGWYEFEDGCRCEPGRFWHTRKDECWETDWSISI